MEHWESEREGEMEDGTVVAMRRVFNKDKRGFSVDKGSPGEGEASALSTNH